MQYMTLHIPRTASHSASFEPTRDRVKLPAAPWGLEIDPARTSTTPSPRSIRNPKRGILMGRSPRQRQFETGVMDMGGM